MLYVLSNSNMLNISVKEIYQRTFSTVLFHIRADGNKATLPSYAGNPTLIAL